MNKYSETASIAILVTNDIHYMHFLAKGEDFDKIHNLAEEYYVKLQDEADYLQELAIEQGEAIVNYNNALSVIKDYDPENESHYDYQLLVEQLIYRLNIYVDALLDLRDVCNENDVESYLDDVIRDWNKEIKYKLNRRLR